MEGQVFVPYTGIRGFNMMTGDEQTNISGSTLPPGTGEPMGLTRVMWTYPGGINNIKHDGQGAWGYAVYTADSGRGWSYDSTIKEWLMGQHPEADYQLAEYFEEAEIMAGGPEVIEAINKLIRNYVVRLLNHADGRNLLTFQTSFPNCWEIV